VGGGTWFWMRYCVLWLLIDDSSLTVTGGCLGRVVSSVEFLRGEEKKAFDNHVGVLRRLGLNYVRREVMEDQMLFNGMGETGASSVMVLEPEIDKLVKFEGLLTNSTDGATCTRKKIPNGMKELLAHATNIEQIKGRIDNSNTLSKPGPPNKNENNNTSTTNATQPTPIITALTTPTKIATKAPSPAKPKTNLPKVKSPPHKKTNVNNFLGIRAAKARAARTARKAAQVKGFQRNDSKKVKLAHTGSGVPLAEVARFKFQKGFTQAVRKPCKFEELI